MEPDPFGPVYNLEFQNRYPSRPETYGPGSDGPVLLIGKFDPIPAQNERSETRTGGPDMTELPTLILELYETHFLPKRRHGNATMVAALLLLLALASLIT